MGGASVSHEFVGGECRITASTPTCYVMLGCRGVGLNSTVKEVMASSVLQVGICVSIVLSMCVLSTYWGWGRILSSILAIHCQGNHSK